MKINNFLSTLKYILSVLFWGILISWFAFLCGRGLFDFLFKYMIPFNLDKFFIHLGLFSLGIYFWGAQQKMLNYNTSEKEYHLKKYYMLWVVIGLFIGGGIFHYWHTIYFK
jgi:hypothetical protein